MSEIIRGGIVSAGKGQWEASASQKKKAVRDARFQMGVREIEKYPAVTTFCLYCGWGEVFDFGFEMEHRSHKLLDTGFSFGGQEIPFRGMRISEECIACGDCFEDCSSKAISPGENRYRIDPDRCDVCGDCYMVCQSGAVEIVINHPAEPV